MSVVDSLMLIALVTVLFVEVSTSSRNAAVSSTSWKQVRNSLEHHVINNEDVDDNDDEGADDEQSGSTG
jgi:hypothetical protein